VSRLRGKGKLKEEEKENEKRQGKAWNGSWTVLAFGQGGVTSPTTSWPRPRHGSHT